MSPRVKATAPVTIGGKAHKIGDIFKARPREARRLSAAGTVQMVNAKGETGREAKRSTRSRKNSVRAKRGK